VSDVNDRPTPAPPPLGYATPDRRARPGPALWAAAGIVWAGAGYLALVAGWATVHGFQTDDELTFLSLAIAVLAALLAAIEWQAVVGRSAAASWLLVVTAGLFCVPFWVRAIGFVESWLASPGQPMSRGDPIVDAALFGVAITMTAFAVTHVAWAWRLQHDRTRGIASANERPNGRT
jgi:hypothetical protein